MGGGKRHSASQHRSPLSYTPLKLHNLHNFYSQLCLSLFEVEGGWAPSDSSSFTITLYENFLDHRNPSRQMTRSKD